MKHLPLLAVLALVLIYNAPAWEYSNGLHYPNMPDVPALERSFVSVADKPLGGFSAWTGPWLYEGAAAFRPLSHHAYWICLYFVFGGMPALATALVALVALSLCSVVYLLVLRLTASVPAAMLAGVLAGVVGFDYDVMFKYIPERAVFAWWPQLDNSLAALFLVSGALLLTHSRRKWALAAFCLALTAKELSIVFPAIVLAFQWHRLHERKTQVLIGASVVAVVAFLAYRAAVIPSNYDGKVLSSGGAYQAWWLYQAWLLFAESRNPLYVLSYAFDTAPQLLRELSLVVASLWLIRLSIPLPQFRALWPALASFAAIYVPLLCMNAIAHRFIIAMPFFCVAVAVAAHGIVQVLKPTVQAQQWISGYKPRFLIGQGARPNSEVVYDDGRGAGATSIRRS